MEHYPFVTLGGNPGCSCGWRSSERPADRSTAAKRAYDHSVDAYREEGLALKVAERFGPHYDDPRRGTTDGLPGQ